MRSRWAIGAAVLVVLVITAGAVAFFAAGSQPSRPAADPKPVVSVKPSATPSSAGSPSATTRPATPTEPIADPPAAQHTTTAAPAPQHTTAPPPATTPAEPTTTQIDQTFTFTVVTVDPSGTLSQTLTLPAGTTQASLTFTVTPWVSGGLTVGGGTPIPSGTFSTTVYNDNPVVLQPLGNGAGNPNGPGYLNGTVVTVTVTGTATS
jgi:hypothetical protein